MRHRVAILASRILASLLAAVYLLAGIGKVVGAADEQFVVWGYAAWFARAIGALELLGGIGLLTSRAQRPAVVGLSAIMLGAVYTHILRGEATHAALPLACLVGLAAITWLRRRYGASA